MPRRFSLVWLAIVVSGCAGRPTAGAVAPEAKAERASGDQANVEPITIYEQLEAKVAKGTAGKDERRRAHERIEAMPDDGTASYAFARAAIAGRLAEERGLSAGRLVTEAEHWARASLQRDPDFRDGTATRLLGSLYVLAPARLVEHGDSEVGLQMLESLLERDPDDPRNHLRVAEAYVALGDPEPALDHLCHARAGREQLPPDERRLLDRLIEDMGGATLLPCQAESSS